MLRGDGLDDRSSPSRREVGAMSKSEARALRAIEGQTVIVEMRDGRRFEDCELVSSGGPGVQTLWLLVDGEDIMVSTPEVVTLAGTGAGGRFSAR
jgi:hypothetical protein